jgi:hypothetical protein
MRIATLSILSFVLGSAAAGGATIDPKAVEPGQAFTISGVQPPSGVDVIVGSAPNGTTVELLFQLSDSGRLVAFAPPHPAGLASGGVLALHFAQDDAPTLGELTVLPTAPPRPDPGAELARIARRQTRSIGWEPVALLEAFDRAPASLGPEALATAVLLRIVDGGEGSIRRLLDATEGTESGERLRATLGAENLISEVDLLTADSGESSLAALPPGAILLPSLAGTVGFASDQRRQFLRDAHPALWREAEDELEITTAAELDFWMEKRAALARHFDSPSLEDWKSDPKKMLESELDRRAADALAARVERLAETAGRSSPGMRLLLLSKTAAGTVFDLFMAPTNLRLKKELAQLPSKLEPLRCSAPASPHHEDDPRGGPSPLEVADWSATVVASNEPWTFTVNDALALMQSLESMLNTLAEDLENIATLGASEAEKDAFMELFEKVNETRTTIQQRHAQVVEASGRGNEALCITGIGCFEEGATAWGPIDVSPAEWVTASITTGTCVEVGSISGASNAGGVFTALALDGNGSWSPPTANAVGYTVADTGTCTLRIMTRSDRFGGVRSEGTTDVTVETILVHVSADPMAAREGEVVRLDAAVANAHDEAVRWTHHGVQEATTTWTAPELGPTECSRDFSIEAESLSRQGIRHSGDPPRTGAITVTVVDPDNRLEVTPASATVRTDQSVQFSAAFAATTASPLVTWTASGGSISADGTFTSSRPGTFEIAAAIPDGSAECAGTAVVNVCDEREGANRYRVTASGEVSRSFADGFAILTIQPASVVGPKRAPAGTCMFSLGIASSRFRPDLEVGIVAALERGLQVGSFAIEPSYGFASDKKKLASIGSFFADAETGPNLNGDEVTSSHWMCDSGQIEISYFDGRYIEGTFQVACEENMPDWKREPRSMTVRGDFAHNFGGFGPFAYGCEPPPCAR